MLVLQDAYDRYRNDRSGNPRALIMEYTALPGIVPRVLLPDKAAVTSSWVEKMHEESDYYSKSR